MNVPTLKTKLTKRLGVIGAMINIPHPMVIEIIGAAGLDFLIIDAEHSPIDRTLIQDLIRAGDAVGAQVIVRIPRPDAFDWIQTALDAGAAGVLLPQIRNADQVRAGIQASKYPPQGLRGSGAGRSTRYGAAIAEDLDTANDRLIFGIMLETVEAVAEIDTIVSIDGLDMVIIGSQDLGLSVTASGAQQSLEEATSVIVTSCVRHQMPCGTVVPNTAALPGLRESGMEIFVTVSDEFSLLFSTRDTVARSR